MYILYVPPTQQPDGEEAINIKQYMMIIDNAGCRSVVMVIDTFAIKVKVTVVSI